MKEPRSICPRTFSQNESYYIYKCVDIFLVYFLCQSVSFHHRFRVPTTWSRSVLPWSWFLLPGMLKFVALDKSLLYHRRMLKSNAETHVFGGYVVDGTVSYARSLSASYTRVMWIWYFWRNKTWIRSWKIMALSNCDLWSLSYFAFPKLSLVWWSCIIWRSWAWCDLQTNRPVQSKY